MKLLFGPLVIQLVWYILKQLFTSVSVKVVDINLAASRLGKYPPLFTSEQPMKIKMTFVAIFSQNEVTLWAASYSACVVYTKTIIHLSVGESDVYLPPLR